MWFHFNGHHAARDQAVAKSKENNFSKDKVVKWKDIEALLLEHYEVGTSKEGADAYPPLVLLKNMLLQKCL